MTACVIEKVGASNSEPGQQPGQSANQNVTQPTAPPAIVQAPQPSMTTAAVLQPAQQQLVEAIQYAGLEKQYQTGNQQFQVFDSDGMTFYGPRSNDPSFAFNLSSLQSLTLGGQTFTLVVFQNGVDGGGNEVYAFFANPMRLAGKIPGGTRYSSREIVGDTLVVKIHNLNANDPLCCPAGPWTTLAELRANANGLYEVQSQTAAAASSACPTIINDPQPPTNVRSAPNGTVLQTLPNGTQVVVSEKREGWLHITSPMDGWVDAPLTTQQCGNTDGQTPQVQLVQQYYALWNQKNYSAMYQLLSAKWQSKHPYSTYPHYHSFTDSISVTASSGASPSDVNVRIHSQDHDEHGNVSQSDFSGTWHLVFENGLWKLETENLKDVTAH
jgi:hypothetical protein